jgi:hypothetical protein
VYTFRLTVKDSLGAQSIARVTITTANPAPPTVVFNANPTTINAGQSSTLSWQVTNADTVSITSLGSEPLNGSAQVSPAVTTTYVLTATRGSQSTQASATVIVNSTTGGGLPIIVAFTGNPLSINAGASSTLSWQVQNATTVSINNGVGSVQLSGTQSVTPGATTIYTLTATNATGNVTAPVTITVIPPAGPKITSFTATPPSIVAGGSSVLACAATNATSLNINGTNFNASSGTLTVSPTQTTTYTCTATGQNGQTDQQRVTVTVTAPPGPIITVAGGTFQTVDRRHFFLDASATISPSGNTPLTYQWVSVDNLATILAQNTATPEIVLLPLKRDFVFRLTVTDSKGNATTATITMFLTDPNNF